MRMIRSWGFFFLSAWFLIGLSTQAHSGPFLAEQVAENSGKGHHVRGHLDEVGKNHIVVDGQRYRLAAQYKIDSEENTLLTGSAPTLEAGQFLEFTLDNNVVNKITVIRPE
jgi:hypothetical protein